MIEVIEAGVNSEYYGFRKSLVISLTTSSIPNETLILKSGKSYARTSNKRWNIIKLFKREGCITVLGPALIDKKTNFRRRWMSLDEIVRIGHIEDEYILEKLRELELIS